MNAFKEKCIELRKADYSLVEISKVTGRPKNSVYFHIKDIPLSKKKVDFIKAQRIERIIPFSAARKGKSLREFSRFKWDESTVNLVSHFIFDGDIQATGCSYNNRNMVLIDEVVTGMKKIYKYQPKIYFNTLTGVNRASYYNVELALYIKEKSMELINKIRWMPKVLKREMLLAFFDDEGCIDFREKVHIRRVRGYQKNVSILALMQKLLIDFRIQSKIECPNEIVILGKDNLVKFQKHINFSKGVCVNGTRSNSIWKKSLEKRLILDNAIKSFRK